MMIISRTIAKTIAFFLIALGHTQRVAAQDKAKLPAFKADFETDKDTDRWPDDWDYLKKNLVINKIRVISWEKEGANHFLRLKSPGGERWADEMRSDHKILDSIPVGTKSLELTWRQRVTKTAKSESLKAIVYAYFLDANLTALGDAAESAPVSESTDGWQTRSMKFRVPNGAQKLYLMPSINGGTFDLDDFALTVTEFSSLAVEAETDKKQAPAEPEWIKRVFDRSSTSLPENFSGNNIVAILDALKANTIKPKGEFEKTTSYANRLNATVAKAMGLQGEWTEGSNFVAPWWFYKPAGKTYNADTENLTIHGSYVSESGSGSM